MILLISPTETFDESLAEALPSSATFSRVATIAEAQAYLQYQPEELPPVALLLFDVTASNPANRETVIEQCHQLSQHDLSREIPIIALIDDLSLRQAVLEMGVDDYLPVPLLALEVKTKLSTYLHVAFRGTNILTEIINQMSQGAAPPTLNRGIRRVAGIFHVPSAWLSLLEPSKKNVRMVAVYNSPPILHQAHRSLQTEIINRLQQDSFYQPQVYDCLDLSQSFNQPQADWAGLRYCLCVPLYYREQLIGVLNFAYPTEPELSRSERRMLYMLGHDIGHFLEMYNLQQNIQTHATQTAFIVLLSRMVSESLDLNTILSLTLEQSVSLLDASGGETWLLSSDGQQLDIASFLSASFSQYQPARRQQGQGLIGWVVQEGQTLYTINASMDWRFNAQVDQIEGRSDYSLLAMPLRHREQMIGVLALYHLEQHPFTNQDTVLMEGVASLAASAIATAQLMATLRNEVQQRQSLYKMSREIAEELDLQLTLDRALDWLAYMVQAEAGLLWLVDDGPGSEITQPPRPLNLVAELGVTLPAEAVEIAKLGQGIISQLAYKRQPFIINNPNREPEHLANLSRLFANPIRNLMVVPMVYKGKTTGILSLFNKGEGAFNKADKTLLSTAIEIIVVAVENAKLHSKTVNLMQEREKLHRQAIQVERLATVGRLTASLSHEINNPMQAIRGALSLALEELDDPEELELYINLCLNESERVVQLINRMRQIYRPQSDAPETIDVNTLIQEAITIANKELNRQRVSLQVNLTPDLPTITGIANQLHLVFLNVILNLAYAIGEVGRGDLELRSYALSEAIQVDFLTNSAIVTDTDWLKLFKKNALQSSTEIGLGFSFSNDIIVAHGGEITFQRQDETTIFSIKLPLVASLFNRGEIR